MAKTRDASTTKGEMQIRKRADETIHKSDLVDAKFEADTILNNRKRAMPT